MNENNIFSLTNMYFSCNPASIFVFVDTLCKLLPDFTWRKYNTSEINYLLTIMRDITKKKNLHNLTYNCICFLPAAWTKHLVGCSIIDIFGWISITKYLAPYRLLRDLGYATYSILVILWQIRVIDYCILLSFSHITICIPA